MRRALGVAIVVYNLDALGGMERQTVQLSERLAARGVHVTIVTSCHDGALRKHAWRKGVEIVRVPLPRRLSSSAVLTFFELTAIHALLRRRRKIDVIYSVQFTCGRHAVAIARVLPRPTLVKLAGGGIQGDLAEILRRPEPEATIADLKEIDHVVCLSDEIVAEVSRAGLDPGRLRRVPNGVDLARFPRLASPREPHAPARLVFVGRLDQGKNVDSILRAFAALRAKNAELDIVGQGPDAEKLRALALELGVSARVHFLGARRDVPDLLRRSHVFLLPSVSEGMSNALLEALAAGVPVVATDIPGTNEIARHEREALLVPVGDTEALRAAIERLLDDPALAARLAAAGRARIEAEFDLERVADRYLGLFRSARRSRQEDPDYGALLRLHARFADTTLRLLVSKASRS